jgi:integrase/recombinase XerD
MLFSESIKKFIANLQVINRSPETVIGYQKELTYFVRFCVEKYNYPPQIEDVTDVEIEEYLKYKTNKNMATASIARALNILNSFYKFLCRKRICVINPASYIDSIKVIKSKKEFLTEKEFKKVLMNTENLFMKHIFITLFNTGLRISELTHLKMEDVDLENKVLHVLGKGSKFRDIPINNTLYNDLIKYLNTRDINSNYFFGTKKTGKVSSQYVNMCLKEAVANAGINKHISCHSMRHSFASILLMHGVSIQDVRDLLGHADLKTTSVYSHSFSANLRNAVNLLSVEDN